MFCIFSDQLYVKLEKSSEHTHCSESVEYVLE